MGHLPARRIPVRAGVAGSPLEVRPTRHAPAGASAARLRVGRETGNDVTEGDSRKVIHGPSPAFGLDWGEVPVGERVPAKRFFCVNRGPFDAEVAFAPWLNPVPGDVSAYYAGDEAETRCAIVLESNPLARFAELPPRYRDLSYCQLLCGVIRGALEMIGSAHA
mgnify:CR=1 FL=1